VEATPDIISMFKQFGWTHDVKSTATNEVPSSFILSNSRDDGEQKLPEFPEVVGRIKV